METNPSEFERERGLLLDSLSMAPRRFVYFGSCGAMAQKEDLSPYMRHKLNMESLVLGHPAGLVLRLPQVVGVTRNSHTLTNFLRERIATGQYFSIWSKAERNLVDIDDVADIGSSLIADNGTPGRAVAIAAACSLPMLEIVGIFERVLGRTAHYSIEPKGEPLRIDASEAVAVGTRLGIDLGSDYAERVVRKYYCPPV